MKKRIGVTVFLVLLVSVVSIFFFKKPVVRIGYLKVTHHLIVGIVEEKKEVYGKCKLKLTEFKDWDSLYTASLQGEVDGVFLPLPLAIKLQDDLHKGLTEEQLKDEHFDHNKIVLLGHRSGHACIVGAESNITSITELRRKTIAIDHVYSVHNLMLHQLVDNASLSYETDITVEVMAPADMPYALAAGEIDAYLVAEPYGIEAVRLGQGRPLIPCSDLLPDAICCVFILNASWIKKHPKGTQDLVDSLVAAGQFIESKPKEAALIGAKFLSEPLDLVYSLLIDQARDHLCYSRLTPSFQDVQNLSNMLHRVYQFTDEHISIEQHLDAHYAEESYKGVTEQWHH